MSNGAGLYIESNFEIVIRQRRERGFVAMEPKYIQNTLVSGVLEKEASETTKRFFIQKRNLN